MGARPLAGFLATGAGSSSSSAAVACSTGAGLEGGKTKEGEEWSIGDAEKDPRSRAICRAHLGGLDGVDKVVVVVAKVLRVPRT